MCNLDVQLNNILMITDDYKYCSMCVDLEALCASH